MQTDRRHFLKRTGDAGLLALLVGAGFIPAGDVAAADWDAAAFGARDFRTLLKMLGAEGAVASAALSIAAPEISENGAVVPIGVSAGLPGLQSIAVLVEKNPGPLAAIFQIPEGTLGELQLRVKMAESSNVMVLARAGGRYYSVTKPIRVTLGGCGG
jgi:sulfur-oxidizing protein SoxY